MCCTGRGFSRHSDSRELRIRKIVVKISAYSFSEFEEKQ
jgi:hypothetical protein